MKQFKRGDVREDGMVFWKYAKTCKNGEYWVKKETLDDWYKKEAIRHNRQVSTKEGHLKKNLASIKRRAKIKNLPFDLTYEYLLSIAPDYCPVFKTKLLWGVRTKGLGLDNSPSLDKFDPKLGYVKGNVFWISNKANTIKNNATADEVMAVAKWMQKTVDESSQIPT